MDRVREVLEVPDALGQKDGDLSEVTSDADCAEPVIAR